jgi:diaminopimelate epimerase
MELIRAHGTGNDFVVLVDRDGSRTLSADLAKALCDRDLGVGADGVIRVAPLAGEAVDGGGAGTGAGGAGGAGGAAAVVMDHRNADGSLAQMCGNGVRVVARVALEEGLVPADADELMVMSASGPRAVHVRRGPDGAFATAAVGMGRAVREPVAVGFDPAWARTDFGGRWHLAEVPLPFDVVSMGNPHAVVPVDDIALAPLESLGRDLQSHPAFTDGVNVGFVTVTDRTRVELRVLERGVGETAACGTGACAAVAAMRARDVVDPVVAVHLPGGVLTITDGPDGLVLEGPAVVVGRMTLDPGWVASVPAATADGWTSPR